MTVETAGTVDADILARAKQIVGSRKVAVTHDWIFARRGGERVLEALLDLFPGADVFYLFGAPHPERVLRLAHAHRFFPSFLQAVPGIARVYKMLLPILPAAMESHDLSGYDLVLSSSHCVAKGIVPAPEARHVCYLHSPMRYAWDQEHRYFPTPPSFARPLEILRRIFLSRLRTWDVASSQRVDAFFANSAFVARRVALYYGRTSEVVHPNVDVERFTHLKPAAPLPTLAATHPPQGKREVLLFSAWVPYKKMRRALEALIAAGVPVVAAGSGAEFDEAHACHNGRAGVTFVPSPTDREVEALYERCHVFLFPPVEDFGIVALEATAAGLWVVAPSKGGTAETVLPGVTGWHFPADDEPAMLAAVREALARDVTAADRAAQLAHARKFSRMRFQSAFLDALASCDARHDARLHARSDPRDKTHTTRTEPMPGAHA